jgi:hypothetical protein
VLNKRRANIKGMLKKRSSFLKGLLNKRQLARSDFERLNGNEMKPVVRFKK